MPKGAVSAAVVVPAAAVIVVFAVLQYRWSNQAEEATSVRLADTLQMSMVDWHLNLFREISEVCLTLRSDWPAEGEGTPEQYLDRVEAWRATAAYPDLVRAVYMMSADGGRPLQARRLNISARRLEPLDWPPSLAALRDVLPRSLPSVPVEATPAQFADAFYNLGAVLANWRFEPDVPALVHPLARSTVDKGPATGARPRGGAPAAGWIVIELDESVLRTKVLPDLARRYFSGTDGLDYEVAVVSGAAAIRVIYSSDMGFGDQAIPDADGSLNVFGRAQNRADRSSMSVFHKPSENKGPGAAVGISWFPLLREGGADEDWRLVVRHRRGGPLGAFVSDMHRRDLAVSFGALLLLVVSMGLLIGASHRAQGLARLQLDFVTAVSHELRTPLTVISSAADNIAHGVVHGADQLTEYGAVIAGQARQLARLVEQLLLFASMREGRQPYTLGPLDVPDVIAAALTSATGLVEGADLTIEQEIQPDLPAVTGDRLALLQCLQNLIINAVKYGGDAHWMRIRAAVARDGQGNVEVEISITDRGIGIDPADLPHVFEPFYRSRSAGARQIRGTGLGLSLARSSAEAMKGSITVASAPGRGSSFTLHLPLAETASASTVSLLVTAKGNGTN